jgi:hypothetical protein
MSYYHTYANACTNGHYKVVRELMNNGYDPSSYMTSLMELSIKNGHYKVVRELLKGGEIEQHVIPSLLRYNDCHSKFTKELLESYNYDPSWNSHYAIKYAAGYGYPKIVKKLLKDKRVDPFNFTMETIIKLHKYGYYRPIIKLLKNNKFDPSIKYDYILKCACRNSNNVKLIKLLLEDERVDPTSNHNIIIDLIKSSKDYNVVGGKCQDAILNLLKYQRSILVQELMDDKLETFTYDYDPIFHDSLEGELVDDHFSEEMDSIIMLVFLIKQFNILPTEIRMVIIDKLFI